jgi:Tol biopolymer transport system component
VAAASAAAGLIVLVALVASFALAANAQTKRVSLKSNGDEVNADNDNPAISRDGRFVAFESVGRFTGGDAGMDADVFVHDRKSGRTQRVSVKSNGNEVNSGDGSEDASISADGRFVAFTSEAALTNGDTNNMLDVFVHDRKTGRTTRVSLNSSGQQVIADSQDPSISADGRYVAFDSEGQFTGGDGNGMADVYERDRKTGRTKRVSVNSSGQGVPADSESPAVSGDGRFVAFQSDGQLTPQADYGPFPLLDADVFVRDTKAKKTSRISLKSNGDEASSAAQVPSRDPAISANGRLVTFRTTGAFVGGDSNGLEDVYVRNRQDQKTQLVSVTSNGAPGNAPSGIAAPAPLSASGRFVAFESNADLVGSDGNGYRDVYLRDRKTGKTRRISVKSNGGAVDANHQEPAISKDGRFVAFASLGAFTGGDSGNDFDVFLRGPLF